MDTHLGPISSDKSYLPLPGTGEGGTFANGNFPLQKRNQRPTFGQMAAAPRTLPVSCFLIGFGSK